MRELTMFYLRNCPYCIRALKYMDELRGEDSRYAQIAVKMIEEQQEKEVADKYDYYYVPCYYLDDEKLHEGGIDKDGVRAVLEKALLSGSAT